MMPFTTAHEWPCDFCEHLRTPDVHPTDIDPPESYCGSREECSVNIRCLRELETQATLAEAYLRGALRSASVRKQEILPALADALADALETVYEDAGVHSAQIRARISLLVELGIERAA